MMTLTIYVASANVTLLNGILNGVAMICQQTAYIWGFAALATAWMLTRAVVAGAMPIGGANALATGTYNAVMPIFLALVLTASPLKSTVQVESTINGKVTAIDNVPFAIAVLPSAVSQLSKDLGGFVTTAFQGTSASYSSISASGNGFINPLKTLLTARSAILKLATTTGAINSQIQTLVGDCIGADSGANYAMVKGLVLNAGNSGATAAQSIAINGVNPTALGALLYQTAQNATGLTTIIDPTQPTTILSCSDGANYVATAVGNGINTTEFARVVQGSVNGTDQPNSATPPDVNTMGTQLQATRIASAVTGTLTGGATQAQQELLNLLFYETTQNALDCLEAGGTNKVICASSVEQAAGMERNNLQQAANVMPMLQYAGGFANDMLTLVIGLGPVIILFMMFSGMALSKKLWTVVHIMTWPLLVMNVGAEIINGMMYIKVSDFLAGITQGGVLSQALAVEAYRQFSVQIGLSSNLMASLPVLMTLIFGMGESSALTSVANSSTPKLQEIGATGAPKLSDNTALIHQTPMSTLKRLTSGGIQMDQGALPSIATSIQAGNAVQKATEALNFSNARSSTIESGKQTISSLNKMRDHGDYASAGFDKTTGASLVENFRKAYDDLTGASNNSGATIKTDQGTLTQDGKVTSVNMGAGAGKGGAGASIGGSIAADHRVVNSKGKNVSANESVGKDEKTTEANAWSIALDKTRNEQIKNSYGNQDNQTLKKSFDAVNNYREALSDTTTLTASNSRAKEATDQVVDISRQLDSSNFVHAANKSKSFQRFQTMDGELSKNDPAMAPYLNRARETLQRNGEGEHILNNSEGEKAVLLHMANMERIHSDAATPEQKLQSRAFITAELAALQGTSPKISSVKSMPVSDIQAPTDTTGVDAASLQLEAAKTLTPMRPQKPGESEFQKTVGKGVNGGKSNLIGKVGDRARATQQQQDKIKAETIKGNQIPGAVAKTPHKYYDMNKPDKNN